MDLVLKAYARLVADERGAQAIEYAIILGLMTIALVAALTNLGTETDAAMQRAADGFPDA